MPSSSEPQVLIPRDAPPAPRHGAQRDSWWESFRIQQRVIGALLMREILTRYGRHNIGFLWLFVEPMIFTVLIALIWEQIRTRHLESISVLAFAVTGYSTVLLWRNMPNRCMTAVEPNLSLMFHRPVKMIDVYLSRILLEAAGGTMAFVFLILIFILFGAMSPPVDPLQVTVGWFMLAWFGLGLALTVGPLTELSPLVEKIWQPISYLSFIFSGAIFLVDMLPPTAQKLMLWVPMVSGVEYLREGYFGPVLKFHYDMFYLTLWNLGLTLFGLAQVRYIRQRSSHG